MAKDVVGTFDNREDAISEFLKITPTSCGVDKGGPDSLKDEDAPFTLCFVDENPERTKPDGTKYTNGGWKHWYIRDADWSVVWERGKYDRSSVTAKEYK
jgi:hypothetical protein